MNLLKNYPTKNLNKSYYHSAREEWLNQHGGRIESDVLKDEKGDYVVMVNKRELEKIYLPRNCQSFNLSTPQTLINMLD